MNKIEMHISTKVDDIYCDVCNLIHSCNSFLDVHGFNEFKTDINYITIYKILFSTINTLEDQTETFKIPVIKKLQEEVLYLANVLKWLKKTTQNRELIAKKILQSTINDKKSFQELFDYAKEQGTIKTKEDLVALIKVKEKKIINYKIQNYFESIKNILNHKIYQLDRVTFYMAANNKLLIDYFKTFEHKEAKKDGISLKPFLRSHLQLLQKKKTFSDEGEKTIQTIKEYLTK